MVFTIILKLFFEVIWLIVGGKTVRKKTLSEITPFDLIYTPF